jgi:hypothetical protein
MNYKIPALWASYYTVFLNNFIKALIRCFIMNHLFLTETVKGRY